MTDYQAIATYRALHQDRQYTKLYWSIANTTGISQALLIEIVEEWCRNNKKNSRKGYFYQDFWWTSATYEEWAQMYPSLGSPRTIQRLLLGLEEVGHIISCQPKKGLDNTKFYRVNEESIGGLLLSDSMVPRMDGDDSTCQELTVTVPKMNNHHAKNEQSHLYINDQRNDHSNCGRESNFGFQVEEVEDRTPKSLATLSAKTESTQLTSQTIAQEIIPPPAARPIKYDPKLGIRPPAPVVKYLYPDGPWLNELGQMRDDFIRDQAIIWQTGDSPNSKAFGAMPIEIVEGKVCSFYSRDHVALVNDYNAYVKKSQRYVSNVQQRINAGISISEAEQQKIIAIVGSVASGGVESAYGRVDVESALPSAAPKLLESVATVPDDVWDVVAQSIEKEQSLTPEGAENLSAYAEYQNQSGSDFYRQLDERMRKQDKPEIPIAPVTSAEEMQSRINALIGSKGMPSVSREDVERFREEERQNKKIANWNDLLQSGLPEVIADVERQARAQGYVIIGGRISEVDF